MIEYDGSKCTAHGQTRCALCASRAAKNTTQLAAPSVITGGPPADIEGFSVRDRLPKTPEEANTEYDKIKAEVDQLNLNRPAVTQLLESSSETKFNVTLDPTFVRDTFSVLPTDDSHASKVLRAAAQFAGAAQAWAQALAYLEKVKKIVMAAEVETSKACFEKDDAEQELKKLVTKEAA